MHKKVLGLLSLLDEVKKACATGQAISARGFEASMQQLLLLKLIQQNEVFIKTSTGPSAAQQLKKILVVLPKQKTAYQWADVLKKIHRCLVSTS